MLLAAWGLMSLEHLCPWACPVLLIRHVPSILTASGGQAPVMSQAGRRFQQVCEASGPEGGVGATGSGSAPRPSAGASAGRPAVVQSCLTHCSCEAMLPHSDLPRQMSPFVPQSS